MKLKPTQLPSCPLCLSDTNAAILSMAQAIARNLGADFTPEPSSEYQRFPAPGKPDSNKACWAYLSPCATYGAYGSYITDQKFTWRLNTGKPLTRAESAALREKTVQEVQKRREMRELNQREAGNKAKAIFGKAIPASLSHPYLLQKRVEPHNLHQQGVVLLVPLTDINGELLNLQRIYPDKSKRFLKGGRVKGLFAAIGPLF